MNRPPQPNRSRNIILIGMPCTGKTTFGRVYAAHTRRQFVDFDAYVERHASRTIPEIFAAEGEAGFRIREQKCLRRLEKKRGVVIAMGGGTLCNASNFRFAQSIGLIVFLNTPLDEIAKRAFREKQLRPLFASSGSEADAQAQVEHLWNLRSEFYECADVILETQHSSLDCLALQMLAVERRAHGLVQRRALPPILASAIPLGAEPMQVSVAQPERSPEPDTATLVEATQMEGEEGGEGVAETALPEGGAGTQGVEVKSMVDEAPRPPAETWDDVVWKRPEEAKPDVKVRDVRRGPRVGLPSEIVLAGLGGDAAAGRRKKRRKGKDEGGQPREGQPRDNSSREGQGREAQPPRQPQQGPRRDGQTVREPATLRDPGSQRDGQRGRRPDGQPPRRDEGGRMERRAGPRDGGGRGPRPGQGGQGQRSDRAPNDRAPNDRAPNDRAPNDRAPNDRAPNDRAPNDRAPNDRAPNDRAPNDRAPRGDRRSPRRGGGQPA